MVLTVTKPTVGGSEDSWGTTINTALDDIVLEINSNADGTNAITLKEGSFAVGATTVTVTGAEFNVLDGDTAATSTTVVDADRVVFNDNGTMKQVAMSDLKTYINASVGSGSVTSVAMTVPTGLSISGSPITTSGTLAVSLQSGYSIPTTSKQSNWDTAYGWGDHSAAGYATGTIPTNNNQLTNGAGYITSVPTTAGGVGTYAFAGIGTTAVAWGGTISGSNIYPTGTTKGSSSGTNNTPNSGINGNGDAWMSSHTSSVSSGGTWRCMGHIATNGNGWSQTVFVRIA